MAKQRTIRPVTKNLYQSITLDIYPNTPGITDFGISSPKHYEALYYPVRQGEISLEQLEEALGNGPKLTELARAARSNPHKDITFKTPWDDMMFVARKVGEAPQTDKQKSNGAPRPPRKKKRRHRLGIKPKPKDLSDVVIRYHGEDYKAVIGALYAVEQKDGSFKFPDAPDITLVDPHTGAIRGLAVHLPRVPLKPNQTLVCGGKEGLRALENAGIVKFTGQLIYSREYETTLAVCDVLYARDGKRIDCEWNGHTEIGNDQPLEEARQRAKQAAKRTPRDKGMGK